MAKQIKKDTEKKPESVEIEQWNQDDEIVEGGIEFRTKYFKRFGAFVRADLNKLILVNIDTGEETELDQPVKMIALYAHPSISLTKGILSGKIRKDWTDDDKIPIARTLISPFGKKQKSLGNFKTSQNIEWIMNPEKYKQLVNRCWVIGRIAEWRNGKENIIFSFGSSAWHSFESARKTLRMYKRHISTNFLELSLEETVNDDGQKYFKPTFKILAGGSTCKEKEFAEKFGKEIKKLKLEHQEESAAIENQIFIPSGEIKYINQTNQISDNIGIEPRELTEEEIPF